ncbi:hypothetical protein GFM12_06900 [Pseudomonas aeruginosa]|uniref:hypothetical protein n=1 Tax=Pseudomonas aeruginosa TaxID=287 RepID=UPI00190E0788|nr:hypothetical protein [Pseudomonas aeruginosa]MBK3752272.1 hypothetical protein [Pseudomonas aeruginosa]MBK3762510.1 hypothetical protein [Pseudomonas aeruginosa]MBK3769050.1 hypothetical protein [Pseudomonas aeruginosa]MBK3789238.1 hypothetical protein [Pseudomonas aeruginosa]MBK3885284.1 hypothetical protein [Pseudomonas aeruginosa]
MLEVALLLVLFFVLPILLGHVSHVLRSPEKLAWYLQVREWRMLEYFLALFIVSIATMYAVAAIQYLTGARLSSVVALALMLVTCLSALGYLWHFAGMTARVTQHKTLLKVLGGLLAVCFATVSKIYSDAAIAELAGLPPQELPASQLFLTFLLTPTLWFLVGSLAAGYLSIPATIFLLGRGLYLDLKKKRGNDKPTARYIAACTAVAFSSLLLVTMMQSLLSKSFYEKRLRAAIAFSSFHLPPSYCGLPNVEGASVTALKYRRAALAVPDEKKGYTFNVVQCESKAQKAEELGAILVKSQEQTAAK